MQQNLIRYNLDNNLPTISTRIQGTWPMFTELVGSSGFFDYVEFTAEYAPYNQYDLENIARAAEIYNMGSMIKVDYQNRFYAAQKALVSGFQSVLFCDHRTAEEVSDTLEKLTPEYPGYDGKMGFVYRRWISNHISLVQSEYVKTCTAPVKAFMIEKAEAVANIDEICSVPGVDMIQFGPADFALSSGFDMRDNPEAVRAAERKCIEAALKHGVAPRAEVNSFPEMQYYLDLGVRHFSVGMQVFILSDYYREQGEQAREMLRKAGF